MPKLLPPMAVERLAGPTMRRHLEWEQPWLALIAQSYPGTRVSLARAHVCQAASKAYVSSILRHDHHDYCDSCPTEWSVEAEVRVLHRPVHQEQMHSDWI